MKWSLKPATGTRGSRSHRNENYGGERADRQILATLNSEMAQFPATSVEAHKLLKALEERVAFHRGMLLSQQRVNRFLNVAFAFLVPITSAITTWVISPAFPWPHATGVASALGLLLTVATIINSVQRPTEKAMTASHLLVQLHDWEMDVAAGLRRRLHKGHIAEDDIVAFFYYKDRELSKIGTEVADRFSPKTTSDAPAGGDHAKSGVPAHH